MTAGESEELVLPRLIDKEGEPVSLTFSGEEFASFSQTDRKIYVSGVTNDDVGSYVFSVTVSDGNSDLTQSIKWTIRFNEAPEFDSNNVWSFSQYNNELH